MTYSIIAKDQDTLAVGTITASVCVGGFVPHNWEEIGCLATQGFYTNRLYASWAYQAFAKDWSAKHTLKTLLDQDKNHHYRQVILMDTNGNTAGWSGNYNDAYCGHECRHNLAVAGNRLADKSVITAIIDAYQTAANLPMALRIIQALNAGYQAGGDLNGAVSGAIKVSNPNASPIDLRVDQSTEVTEDLNHLYQAYQQENFQRFINAIPTYNEPDKAGYPST